MPAHRVTRRRMLAALSASGISTIAGCGSKETDKSEPTTETSPGTRTTTPTEAPAPQPSDFVDVNGTNFTLAGDVFYYNGGQSAPTLESPSSQGQEYDYDDEYDGDTYTADMMLYASNIGMNVFRSFLGPDWDGRTMHEGPGEFNEAWFKHFDRIVAEAKKNNIRLIVPMLSLNRNPVAPSPLAYASWSETIDDDLSIMEKHDAFFTDDQARGYHRNFIEHFLTRENTYTGLEPRNDPTFMMWECGNEIEYSPRKQGESLAHWYDEAARFIKSIDHNHIVGTGMYGSDERNDFIADHQSDAIDACSIHYYPGFPDYEDIKNGTESKNNRTVTPIPEMQSYFETRIDQARNELEKPIYLGEFGFFQVPFYGWDLDMRYDYFEALYETADNADLNGVNPYALELNLKHTGEPKITNGRDDFAIYPGDRTTHLIREYGERTKSKSAASL